MIFYAKDDTYFSSGVYVVKTIYTDGTFNINKIIK